LCVALLYIVGCVAVLLQQANDGTELWTSMDVIERRSFTRAAFVYLPKDQKHRFLHQLKWFLRSWEEMRGFEPPDWRTDVVVVTDGSSKSLEHLNCSATNKRKNRVDAPVCVVVENYVPAKKKKEFKEIDHYPFADSLVALATETDAFDHYDWLLRADLDTFLTEGFATWSPPRMVVGRGSFCFPGYKTCERLHKFAAKQNLTDAGVDNIGSGWYGPTAIIRECARQASNLMVTLSKEEFSKKEKERSYYLQGIKGWPRWHYGVLSMYAGQLAINNCSGPGGFDKRADLLDFPSSSTEHPSKHPHLHTWQDHHLFSKADFAAGKYDKMNLSSMEPLHSARDYALWVAMVGNGKVGPRPLLHPPGSSALQPSRHPNMFGTLLDDLAAFFKGSPKL